jgi:hypothetical protein
MSFRPATPLATMLALAPLATLLGCEPPPAEEIDHDVLFVVTSDVGEPVPGTRLFRPGTQFGVTDRDGRFATRFRAPDGTQLTVHAMCPEGYVDPTADTSIVLRELSAVATRSGTGRRVNIQCRRTRVVAAVVVRAGFPDLPVLYEGEEITRTGPTGVAHVSAAVPPHATFSLSLDTSDAKRLRPKNPSATFTMAGEDGFYVFDSGLERIPEPRPPPKKKKPKPKPKPPDRPILIPPNAHLGR